MRPIGILGDVDDLVDPRGLQPLQPVVIARLLLAAVQRPGQGRIEGLADQRALAAAADPGDAGKDAERKADRQVLQVVLAGADHGQPAVAHPPPAVGRLDLQLARQIQCR